MVRFGRRMPRVTSVLTVATCAVMLSNCSWQRLEDADGASTAGRTTVADEMRTVPTVPPATEAPDVGSAAGGAVVPATPSTTELVGDPQPNPDSTSTLPPLPASPVVEACTRLAEGGAADIVGPVAGAVATTEPISEQACRITAGSVVAEVYFVTEDVVSSEWFVRDGIQPVGEVGGDVVGIATFSPPGSGSDAGFTLAMISRRQGAVVAVRGATENRDLAVQLALAIESMT